MNEKKAAPSHDLPLPSGEEVNFLWDAMSKAQDEAQSITGKYKTAVTEAENLKKEVRHLRKILDEKIKAEQPLSPDEIHARLERLNSELEVKQKIIEEKELAACKLREEIRELCSQLGDYRVKTAKLENEQALHMFSIGKLENKISSLNHVIDQKTKQNIELSEKVKDEHEEHARLARTSENLSGDLKNSQLIANAAMRKVADTKAENDSLRGELSRYGQSVASLEKELDEKQKGLILLKQELEHKQQELEQKQQKLEHKQKEIISLQQELEKNVSPVRVEEEEEEETVSVPSVLVRHVRKPLEAVLAGLKTAAVNAAPAGQRQMRTVLQKLSFILDSLKIWEEYSDTSQYEPASCQIKSVLDPLIEAWKKHFSAKRISLIGRFAPNLPKCAADPKKLKIAFYQIIRNSYEALAPGGILTISVSEDAEKNCVLARFSDTGPGVSPKTAKTMYTPFACARAGHLGLGIATAKKIAEKSGGGFSIAGQPKGGTLAEFSFPAAPAETPSMEV